MTSRAAGRSRFPLLALGLVSALAVSATGAGATGCGQCAALCGSFVEARGALAVEPGMTIAVQMCLGDDCAQCSFAIEADDEGAVEAWSQDDCDGVQANVVEGGALQVLRGSEDIPRSGQVVSVTITSVDSGEVLVETVQPIEGVRDESMCGTTCGSGTISWD